MTRRKSEPLCGETKTGRAPRFRTWAVGPAVFVVWLLAGTPILFAQTGAPAADSWIYTGDYRYTRPQTNFGIVGYSNPQRTTPIPPAAEPPQRLLSAEPNAVPAEASLKNFAAPTPAENVLNVERTVAPALVDDEAESVAGSRGYSPIEPSDRLSAFMLEPRPERSSLLQGAAASMGYIPNVGDRRAGITSLAGSATFGFPLPDANHPLLVTPDISWWDYSMADSQQTLFGKKLDFYSVGGYLRYLLPIHDQLMFDLSFGLHWNSDFNAGGSEALRPTGTACAVWKWTEQSRAVLGVSYTDLSDWTFLPVAGVLWKPSDDLCVEAYFPRPKIARRLTCIEGAGGGETPYWGYLAGEFEGNRWVFRTEGTSNGAPKFDAEMTYYDFRLLAGIERRTLDDLNWAIEGGVVLGRNQILESRDSAISYYEKSRPRTAGLVRLKVMY